MTTQNLAELIAVRFYSASLGERIGALEAQLFARISNIQPTGPAISAPPPSNASDPIDRWRSQISPPLRIETGPHTDACTDSELVSMQSSPKGKMQGSMLDGVAGQVLRLQPPDIPVRESSVDSFAQEDGLMGVEQRHVSEDIQEDDTFACPAPRMNRLDFASAAVASARITAAST